MSTAERMHQIVGGLPRHRSQVVVAYYLLTVLTGVFVLSFHGRLAFAADLLATVFYIAMTALFYDLSKPGNRRKWSAAPVPVHDGVNVQRWQEQAGASSVDQGTGNFPVITSIVVTSR
jgi:hypothetical protein